MEVFITEDELTERLIEWGEWFVRCDNGLGSPQSTLGRLITDGGILTHAFGPKIPPENPQAQQIEDIISALHGYNHFQYAKCVKVLRVKYTASHYLKAEKLARKLGISTRTFQRRLKTGRECVKLRLEIIQS